MRGKFISQGTRQIIHKWLVAKRIFPLPVNSMRLEGIAAIGDEDHRSSAGLESPKHFTDGSSIILNVFEYFMAENQVKRRFRKREGFPGGVNNMMPWMMMPQAGTDPNNPGSGYDPNAMSTMLMNQMMQNFSLSGDKDENR